MKMVLHIGLDSRWRRGGGDAGGELVCQGSLSGGRSALWFSQGGSVDADGLALMSQPAEQGIGQIFVPQQLVPLVILKVRCKESRFAAVAFFREFDEDVG